MYYTQCMRGVFCHVPSQPSVIPQPKFSGLVNAPLPTAQGSSRSAEIPSEERQNPRTRKAMQMEPEMPRKTMQQRREQSSGEQRCGSGQEILEGALGSRGKVIVQSVKNPLVMQ